MDFEKEKLLDINAVKYLKSLIGKDDKRFFSELIELYKDESKPALMKLKEAYKKNDVNLITDCAGSIKNSALNIGANRVGKIASYIENAQIKNNYKELGKLIKLLEDTFYKSLEELAEL
ncbi:MAG: Hpt domain-containing protein [Ignavibacteria bacterium]|nr:Hpt domain-containing protein [Ignavibacteria bacterium]